MVFPREADGGMTQHLRAGDMDHVGREAMDVLLDAGRQQDRQTIFGTAGQRHGRHADQIADMIESGAAYFGRIDPNGRTLPEQIFDEPVQGLVRAISDIIIVTAEEGHAEVGHVHRGSIAEVTAKATGSARAADKAARGSSSGLARSASIARRGAP